MTTLQMTRLGVVVEIREHTAELIKFDVIGRTRGFLTQAHIHTLQSERQCRARARFRPYRPRRPAVGAGAARALQGDLKLASREYLFVDERDAALRKAVIDAIADARSYPQWWAPVYLGVDAEGEPELGKSSRQHFKGRLPYRLNTRSTIVRLEPPHVVEGEVDGASAATAAGRSPTCRTAARTCASTGASTPTSRCCARSPRSCARPSAGTTRGRSRAREGLEPHARARVAARVTV